MSNDITSNRPMQVNVGNALPVPSNGSVEVPRPRVAETAAAVAKPSPAVARKTLEETTAHLNELMQLHSRDLAFSVDDKSNRIVVKVKNHTDGEIVIQIPSEVALRISHSLENIKGLVQDKTS